MTSVTQVSPCASLDSAATHEYQSPNTPNEEDRILANLEQIPSRDTEWDEERRNRESIPVESDDVNALSLSVDRQTSYLGASSIKAALMVMVKVSPRLRSYLLPPAGDNRRSVPPPTHLGQTPFARPGPIARPPQRIQWSSEGQTLIDAYFNRVQIFIPMLDEPSFRADFLGGRRNDPPWLGLLNMVFVMGSIAAMKSDDHGHMVYWERAREHLNFDCFGEGHIETLQALILAGGYYLHYINRPNLANAITGAALRMACALGLHRETGQEIGGNQNDKIQADLRRRTWWSLFCLDTWANSTLGRPSLRWGPAITIRLPEGAPDAIENATNGQHIRVVPLIENVKFAKIATRIQDTMALSPLPPAAERTALDNALVEWSNNLPWVLRCTEPCPEAIYTARCVLKWRYQNLRIVLHRPVLLNLASRGPRYKATEDELHSVELCRLIAKQTIGDIGREWTQNQMSGWNAVWFLYQAAMIPLVSMFWEWKDATNMRDWQLQIESVLGSLNDMSDWSLSARRSREVVLKMFEASKGPRTREHSRRPSMSGLSLQHEQEAGPSGQLFGDGVNEGMVPPEEAQQMTELMMEEGMFLPDGQSVWDVDGMLWGNMADGLGMPFDGVPGDDGGMQYDYMMHQG